jgi:hypothetical protein
MFFLSYLVKPSEKRSRCCFATEQGVMKAAETTHLEEENIGSESQRRMELFPFLKVDRRG